MIGEFYIHIISHDTLRCKTSSTLLKHVTSPSSQNTTPPSLQSLPPVPVLKQGTRKHTQDEDYMTRSTRQGLQDRGVKTLNREKVKINLY